MFKNIVLKRIFLSCLLIFISTSWTFPATLTLRKVAFFPLQNLSGNKTVPEQIVFEIAQRLKKNYGFEVILPSKLEDFFLRYRVRRFGVVTQAQAKELKKLFGIDAIIITWIDLYEESEHPKIGIGLRMVAGDTGIVLWGNYVALVSQDFTSWFLQGEIHSIRQLVDKALTKLLADFPRSFRIKLKPIEKPLFVIEDFSFSPSITRGGQPVNVTLHLVSLKKPPKRIFLLLAGERWPLKRKNNHWEADIHAPYREGKYYANLKLIKDDGTFNFLKTAHFLKVDNTPPQLRISYENLIFSPNEDGVKDTMIFFPTLLYPDSIRLWSFFIYDKNGKIVRRFEGYNELPLGLAWHGETDGFSKVKEGTYYLVGVCQDEAGNKTITPKKEIVIDNTPPKLNILADLGKREIKFRLEYEEDSKIDKWSLSISDKSGNIFYSTSGQGGPPEELSLPLSDEDPSILYVLAEATDVAGNKGEYKNSLIFKAETIEKEKGKEKIKKKIPSSWDYEF